MLVALTLTSGPTFAQCTPDALGSWFAGGGGGGIFFAGVPTSSGDTMYGARTSQYSGNGVVILDASNPGQLLQVGQSTWNMFNPYTNMIVDGDRLYGVFSQYSGWRYLFVLDVSNPAAPIWLYQRNLPTPFLLSGRIHLENDLLFFAYRNSTPTTGVVIWDVSGAPVELGGAHPAVVPTDVEVEGDIMYLMADGLELWDITNPASTAFMSRVPTAGTGGVVVQSDNLLYTSVAGMLEIFDITVPSSPVSIGLFAIGGSVETVRNDVLYLNRPGGGIVWYDVSDPTNPTLIDSITHNPTNGWPLSGFSVSDTKVYARQLFAGGWGYVALDLCTELGQSSPDRDEDGVPDDVDNCPDTPNADQADDDGDGIGDVCDVCPLDHNSNPDDDGDGVCNADDVCPGGDDALDADGDDLPDFCDPCPFDPDNDIDGDGVCGSQDNCPDTANADQLDTDGDLMGDACDEDDDNDGLSDVDEAALGTDPLVVDSDGDGLSDGDEVNTHGTSPTVADTDGDGLSDGDELNVYGTDPLAADSDGDGLSDGFEISIQEFGCPDPLVADSDMDGLDDGFEIGLDLDACDDADFDGDGLGDAQEVLIHGTDPLLEDTDGDGMFDGTEVDVAQGTGCPDPLNPDSDGDTLPDGVEAHPSLGTDPCSPDTDGDTVPDNIDDLPTVPGVTSGYIEEELLELCEFMHGLTLDNWTAPNANSANGRRGAMCNTLSSAAKAMSKDKPQQAWDKLDDLLDKVDRWMVDFGEGDAESHVRATVEQMMLLISYEL